MLLVALALAPSSALLRTWPLHTHSLHPSTSHRARPSPTLIEGYQNGCASDQYDSSLYETRGRLEASLERESLKSSLLSACAKSSRGFGATATDRNAVADLVAQLHLLEKH